MRRYSIGNLKPEIVLEKCNPEDMSLIKRERGKEIQDAINNALANNVKGWFLDKAFKYLNTIETYMDNGEPLYTLLPFNYILWLYDIGLGKVEEKDFFNKLATQYRKLAKSSARRGPNMISVNDAPVTPTMLSLLRTPRAFDQGGKCTFLNLQGIITGLCFLLRGWRSSTEEKQIMGIFDHVTPSLQKFFSPIIVNTNRCKVLSAIYTAQSPACNVYLFRMCRMSEAVSLLFFLLSFAKDALNIRASVKTNVFTRQEFFSKILAFMQLSAQAYPLQTMRYKILGGQDIVW